MRSIRAISDRPGAEPCGGGAGESMIAGMFSGDDRPTTGGEGGPDRAEARAAEAPAAPAAPPADRRALLWLLVAMTAWAGWFIFRTSFVAGGRRVFCLFDDAMISMTYARN